jgi:hypothetical protein
MMLEPGLPRGKPALMDVANSLSRRAVGCMPLLHRRRDASLGCDAFRAARRHRRRAVAALIRVTDRHVNLRMRARRGAVDRHRFVNIPAGSVN